MSEQDTAVTDMSPAPAPVWGPTQDCVVLLQAPPGELPGKVFRLGAALCRLGRGSDNDIVLEDERVSRHHATLERLDSGWAITDNRSAHGTWIDGARIKGTVPLVSGARFHVGTSIFKFVGGDDIESKVHEEIYRTTICDPLTGLANRRKLDQDLEREHVRARRHGRTYSVLMLDVDHFKRVNDTYGHSGGDAVLIGVSAAIVSATRNEVDLVARYGGEEIAVLAPETGLASAVILAERIRATVESLVIEHEGRQIRVTLSVGCAEFSPCDENAHATRERADSALYRAKHGVRNRVASEPQC